MPTINEKRPTPADAESNNHSGLLIASCAAASFADGYDMSAIGHVVPRLIAETGLTASDYGSSIVTSMLGLALGALLIAPLGDRYGQRPLIKLNLWLVAITTLVTAIYGANPTILATVRFFSGLGLGAIVPIAVALTASCAPAKHRVLIITMVVTAAGAGSFACGLIAPLFDANLGWSGIFYCGALMPALAAMLVPNKKEHQNKSTDSRPAVATQKPPSSIRGLFAGHLILITLISWVLSLLNLGTNYSMMSWLPTILSNSGWDAGAASRTTGMVSGAGIIGGLAISAIADRGYPILALVGGFLAAAIGFTLLAFLPPTQLAWTLGLAVVGASIFGTAMAMSGVFATLYPASLRATALGWATGIGRLGSLLGPIFVVMLLDRHVSPGFLLGLFSIPMFLCAVLGAFLFSRRGARQPTNARPKSAERPSPHIQLADNGQSHASEHRL